jgi:hypothetical protein
MNEYSMTCSCGDAMKIEADSREGAVTKLQSFMDAESIAAHMAEKHPSEVVPSLADIHAQIAANVEIALA